MFNIPLTGERFEKSFYVLQRLVVVAIVLGADEGESRQKSVIGFGKEGIDELTTLCSRRGSLRSSIAASRVTPSSQDIYHLNGEESQAALQQPRLVPLVLFVEHVLLHEHETQLSYEVYSVWCKL